MNDKLLNIEKNHIDSLIIYSKDRGILYKEASDNLINIRSIAKFVTSLACGVLIDKSNGNFNEDTLIYDILKDKLRISNTKNIEKFKKIRVKDCLTHTMGYRDIILMSEDIANINKDNLLDYTLSYPIYFKPGQKFLYSNAGYYVLAATMQEYLGYDLYTFIDENIFSKLDIMKPKWDSYGKYLAGATKLYLSAEDMFKLGKIIINNGYYENQKIVSSSWIEKMQANLYRPSKDYESTNLLSDDYYGYSLWSGKDNIKYASGTGGQYLIFLQKLGIIIISTNEGDVNKAYLIKNELDGIIKNLKEEKNGL
ncbi:serine hydrolase [uncultured Anaerococcus sp.]|uniref:serine hydrolase domain-containing protein n=1 Tax=uncultured Anaerococcus sp. TaxID=293428 RepID=UPI0025F53914|nr:serine hydrolase domain-containing protein [uncultured Anaerococcus sp.]